MTHRFREIFSPGDVVRWVPHNPRRHEEQVGSVVAEVNDHDGYNLLIPLPGDPYRQVRLWCRDGEFEIVKKHVKEQTPAVKSSTPASTRSFRDPRHDSLEELAERYRGMTPHDAWNQYIKDTGLRPQFDLKDLIKAMR